MISAVMARLADPTVSLAAYGGVIFPFALLIESPIIMLLAASTALSKDWQAYCLMRRFMWIGGLSLSAIHLIVAFTPLYYLYAEGILGVPQEIVEPARLGMMIMVPWSAAIASRRFQQGVLIRFGKSREVGLGTAVRLISSALILASGFVIAGIPGIAVGTMAVAVGVVSEALYIGWRVRPVLNDQLRHAPPSEIPLTWGRFARFYTPLFITPFFMFLALPMASAAMSRMPRAMESLAVWPVWNGIVFALRSICFAYNEVVVALLERPQAVQPLWKFAVRLAAVTSAILALFAVTPLGVYYFGTVSALAPPLVAMGMFAMWLALPLPGLTALQNFYQGVIVHSHRTRAIPESILIYLVTIGGILAAGILYGQITGIYVAVVATGAGNAVQVGWLAIRSRNTLDQLSAPDVTPPETPNLGAAAS